MKQVPPHLDHHQLRRAFDRAAASYERHDALQREVEARLFESLDYYERAPDYQGLPQRVLDTGCGSGRGTARLKKRWPKAQVIAVDVAPGMLRAARRHSGWRRPLARVCADALALPFADHCMDIVYSNLCMQWCESPRTFLREMNRVLKPGGLLVASSLGPDTLHELRAAWATIDPDRPHVSQFIDMHDIGDAALAAGLKDPVLDADHITLDYADAREMLADLKGLGATNAEQGRATGLTGKTRFKAMLAAYETQRRNGRIPATFEVVTLHAWGPPKGFLPRYGGRETPFEVIEWAERKPRH